LVGQEITARLIADVAGAATRDLEASSDLHATASYRRRVASALGARALEDAVADAKSSMGHPA
jgi:CO/xanthine dehydrogenase FAD-binding subunit